MGVRMRSPQGAVADVADESVEAFTTAGWATEETKPKAAEGDGRKARTKSE